MSLQLSYKRLFSIELLHEYHADGKCMDFEIVPADDCMVLFKNLHIEWRNNGNQFAALIREEEEKPFMGTPAKETIFRLYLKLKNHYFLNYTNIDLSIFATKRLLFSNLANNKATYTASGDTHTIHYLSHKINDVAAQAYTPVTLVMKPGTDQVYEAVKKNTVTNVGSFPPGPDLWVLKESVKLPKVPVQYPTAANDAVLFTSGLYHFQVPATRRAEINIFGPDFVFTSATPITYNIPVMDKQVVYFERPHFEDPQEIVQVDFSSLKPGKYKVEVNGQSKMIYYDPKLASGAILAVVEIYNHLPGTHDYALLDDSGKIKSIPYTIRFLNRSILWKYTSKDNTTVSLVDTVAGGYKFRRVAAKDFVSEIPIPLSALPVKTIALINSGGEPIISPVPNPSAHLLGKHEQDDFTYLCSGMHLNY